LPLESPPREHARLSPVLAPVATAALRLSVSDLRARRVGLSKSKNTDTFGPIISVRVETEFAPCLRGEPYKTIDATSLRRQIGARAGADDGPRRDVMGSHVT